MLCVVEQARKGLTEVSLRFSFFSFRPCFRVARSSVLFFGTATLVERGLGSASAVVPLLFLGGFSLGYDLAAKGLGFEVFEFDKFAELLYRRIISFHRGPGCPLSPMNLKQTDAWKTRRAAAWF